MSYPANFSKSASDLSTLTIDRSAASPEKKKSSFAVFRRKVSTAENDRSYTEKLDKPDKKHSRLFQTFRSKERSKKNSTTQVRPSLTQPANEVLPEQLGSAKKISSTSVQTESLIPKGTATQTEPLQLEKEHLQEPDKNCVVTLEGVSKKSELEEHISYFARNNVTRAVSDNQNSILLRGLCKRPVQIDDLHKHLQYTFTRFCKTAIFDDIQQYHRNQASPNSLENRMQFLLATALAHPDLDSVNCTEALHDVVRQPTPELVMDQIKSILSEGTSMDILCLIYMTLETLPSEKTVQANI